MVQAMNVDGTGGALGDPETFRGQPRAGYMRLGHRRYIEIPIEILLRALECVIESRVPVTQDVGEAAEDRVKWRGPPLNIGRIAGLGNLRLVCRTRSVMAAPTLRNRMYALHAELSLTLHAKLRSTTLGLRCSARGC